MIPKFRAWVKRGKFMGKVYNINFDNENCWIRTKEGKSIEGFNNIELMQSTGVKDKNGVEIFEGDIVKATSIFYGTTEIFYVVYKDGYFGTSDNAFGPIGVMSYHYEVIGNIYENPELLGGDK